MRPRSGALLALVLFAFVAFSCEACGRSDAARARPTPAPSTSLSSAVADSIHCKSDPTFPAVLEVPEASAATEVELAPGVREILVVSDSDRNGAALAYALPEGPARALTLPLDPHVSDDIEGLSWLAGHLYAVVSIGYIERFTPVLGALTRDMDGYPLGPPPFVASWPTPSDRPPDFEGLCLRPPSRASDLEAPPTCAGYAASRAYGWLVCLVFDGDRLRVSPDHPRLALDLPKQSLSDCAFGAADGPARGDLLVTTNIRGGSTVYRVSEKTGALTAIDVEGTANNEAIAVDHDGRLYQMMDPNTDRSPAVRATCSGW
jgi:hypothetical protein